MILLFLSLLLTSAAVQDIPPENTLTVGINGEEISIKGKRFLLPAKSEDLQQLLGKPSREAKLTNTVLTWDDLGIVAYLYPGTEIVRAVTVAFTQKENAKEEYSYWPKKMFGGKLIVDGVRVLPGSSVAQINANKAGKPFEQDNNFRPFWIIQHENITHYLVQPEGKEIRCVSVNVRVK
jgi:hypothetical protein